MPALDMLDMLPDFTLKVGASGTLNLPGDLGGDYAVILFYRGHW